MSIFSVCPHYILFKTAFSLLLVFKAIQYAPAHLLGGWIVSFNQHPELLVQTLSQTIRSVLLLTKNAYDARDMFVNTKLQSFVGTLDKHTQAMARSLVYNPITVDALLALLDVPLWNTYLMTKEKLDWLQTAGFSDLVSVVTSRIYTNRCLTMAIVEFGHYVQRHVSTSDASLRWPCGSFDLA
jgi:hypothetical protein